MAVRNGRISKAEGWKDDKATSVGRSGQSEQRKTRGAAVAGIRWLENGPQYPYFSRTLARIEAGSFYTHTHTSYQQSINYSSNKCTSVVTAV